MKSNERLIVALDVDTQANALGLVRKLKDSVSIFKVGLELFSSCGPDIVRKIKSEGAKIFLDLKFHDIPNTVAQTVTVAARMGVDIMNVHALGGFEMMKKASEALDSESKKLKIKRPKLIAVTILTSMDENDLKKVGVDDNMKKEVLRLAALAQEAGLDGVVASPSEVRLIRERIRENKGKIGENKGFIIVTPGARPSWAATNDQKRIATPKEAIDNGADMIVVGRPITEAPDPVIAARKILEEIRLGLG